MKSIHVFSKAVLILPQRHLLVCCISAFPSSAQSPLVYLPSDIKFVFQQQSHSAWEKWDLIPAGAQGGATTTNINTTQALPALEGPQIGHFRGKEATKTPRDAVGGITWKKYLGYAAGFWLKLSKPHPLWTSLCESFWRPTCPQQTQFVWSLLYQLPDATSFLQGFAKLQIQVLLHSSISANYSYLWPGGQGKITDSVKMLCGNFKPWHDNPYPSTSAPSSPLTDAVSSSAFPDGISVLAPKSCPHLPTYLLPSVPCVDCL